ncbi:LysR family transcriptional regulator [Actinokineospora globicatena]|uniref:LysR family transcriptional regulator n=1 Tax=Actinokineospora globicatena TaxID=103729 RepID=A0A9W6QKK5_9PSEU|nr:LysR family transcriptional regulator [Actinokineospora globicatena]MCP2303293.1 DNA-binding transcriptional regulator, LysR family [Actinokineospora globicatena]GLW79577.1 LysR family transcriptional regulator [Actinokineospora globicatena]GLW86013.1 LysR family transcriptional regulator [Actinokineospora globicatena]GLW90189.1 LysR family transcriptional regulator [Actinokineospora globicatena]
MANVLDILPLRSFVAVADRGGFQRAATHLHLSQAAVSGHVRRLEAATGRRLVERDGRRSRFTPDGDRLLGYARRILALHDESLRALGVDTDTAIVIGSTEHAAAQLLPQLSATLEETLPEHRVRYRLDRGTALRDALGAGRMDLALLLGATDDPRATLVGELDLTWYSAPGWVRPDGPVPLVAFDNPCALRTAALETLAAHRLSAEIGAEANQLAGVHAATAAGLGVAVLATCGTTPQGLVPRRDLPVLPPLPLYTWRRQDLDPTVLRHAVTALRDILSPNPTPLAQGA